MTKEISYAADGSIESYVEYENDTNGNCIKYTEYDADGEVTKSKESKYDSNNNCLGSTAYDSDGNITDSYEYEFDDNGNEVEEPMSLMAFRQRTKAYINMNTMIKTGGQNGFHMTRMKLQSEAYTNMLLTAPEIR